MVEGGGRGEEEGTGTRVPYRRLRCSATSRASGRTHLARSPASPTARGGFASSRFDPYASGSAFADADGLSMSVGSAAGASSFGGGWRRGES